jgi:hypothetical protein
MRGFGSWRAGGCRRRAAVCAGCWELPDDVFTINGLRFHFDAGSGQKTGAFLDQRLNYAAAARYARGRALDVCTYQGGFALHLAQRCERGDGGGCEPGGAGGGGPESGAESAAAARGGGGLRRMRLSCCGSLRRRASGSTRSCSTRRRLRSRSERRRGRCAGTRS